MSKEKAVVLFDNLLNTYYITARERNKLKGRKLDPHQEAEFKHRLKLLKEEFLYEINHDLPMWKLVDISEVNGIITYTVISDEAKVRILSQEEYNRFKMEGFLK